MTCYARNALVCDTLTIIEGVRTSAAVVGGLGNSSIHLLGGHPVVVSELMSSVWNRIVGSRVYILATLLREDEDLTVHTSSQYSEIGRAHV